MSFSTTSTRNRPFWGVWAVHFPQDRPLISAHFNNFAFLEKQNQFNHPSPSISPVDHSNFNYQSENFYREYLEYSLALTALTPKIGQNGSKSQNLVI